MLSSYSNHTNHSIARNSVQIFWSGYCFVVQCLYLSSCFRLLATPQLFKEWVSLFREQAWHSGGGTTIHQLAVREQGWRSSNEITLLSPMWSGFDSRHHMLVEFVVGSCPCSERFFSGYSSLPLSSKTNISNFQFNLECPQ